MKTKLKLLYARKHSHNDVIVIHKIEYSCKTSCFLYPSSYHTFRFQSSLKPACPYSTFPKSANLTDHYLYEVMCLRNAQ